ncbi:hypothetical protein [Streptomyces fulvoviolaceus]|uniref:hypothetical protein n=1 Tax=Streptomyces fulvoviolaceus TaxID=285535 RepID=UPI0004CC1284|nr:hypothetical protein [Streptomyces fulvoviolaceus]
MQTNLGHGDALLTVRVGAALIGPAEHRRTARALFEEMGWEVLDADEAAYPAVRTPGGVLPDEAVRNSVYTLAIPVRRDSGLRPERWAVQEVKDLADDAHLDLRPVSARMLRRQRRQEPHWFVCAPRSTHSNPWRRWLFDRARSMGFHDTGTVLFGSYEEAQRCAGRGRVRPPFPRRVQAHNGMRRTKVVDSRRWVLKAVALSWAAGVLGIPITTGPWWLALPAVVAWTLLTWWCAAVMLPSVRRQRRTVRRRRTSPPAPDGPRTTARGEGDAPSDEEVVVHRRKRWHAWLAALATSGALLAVTAFVSWMTSPATTLGMHFLLAGAVFVTAGIRHLARAGSRRPFLVAVLVALLPVAIPAFGGLSPVLFTFYGAAFHVRAEEMDVAEAWQFLASADVLGISGTLTLVFLACWGYLRPLFRLRTLRLLLPVVALTGAMAITLAWTVTVLDGASAAGEDAVRQWRAGRVPDHYYGANPRPVCVAPIGPVDELPLYGNRLDPEQVYGTFGVVDGQVTLWDPESGNTFSVPSDAVQVLPAGDGEPGTLIPLACRSII